MAIDIVKIVVYTMFTMNLLLGIGNYVGRELETASSMTLYGEENLTIIDINFSEFEDVTDQLSTNPTVTGIGGALYNVYNIIYGIPAFTGRIMGIVGIDTALRILVEGSLVAIVSLIYFLFAMQVISYLPI